MSRAEKDPPTLPTWLLRWGSRLREACAAATSSKRNSFLVAFSWTEGEENFTAGENSVQECSDPPTSDERTAMQALNGWP